jgi:quercetin dioxygenase-like cupin family protein
MYMTKSKKQGTGLAIAVIAVALVGANVLPSAAQQPPPPIATEILTGRAVFTDDVDLKMKIKLDGHRTRVVKAEDPSRTLVARITVQPGAQFPWHSHAGPVVVNVTKGELVYVDGDDCVERPYAAGTAFVDAGHGHTHTAFNATGEETVIVATFYEAPAQGPLLIPAQAPSDCDV